ncbi:unnamed protein product [Durusdinium trenchii]|uniref:Uncharacterized protein n=1 Tax=Durusdinium trenchii TaxID=1381693 RepID=A0ABP0QXX5_9DINO
MALLQPDAGVLDLFRALDGFHKAYWRSSHEPVASRAVTKLRQPLVELVGLAVVNVLEEMRSGLSDPRVQWVGVSFLRAALHDSNGTTKDIIQRAGVLDVLVRVMTSHASTEHLLAEALAVLDELHGLPALLQALDHLRSSPAASKAALVQIRNSARARWHEVEQADNFQMMRVILMSLQAHQDPQVILLGLQLLGDLAGDLPETRSAFFNLGGWDWLLQLLESWDQLEIQQEGIRMVSQLCKGGACGDAFAPRVEKVLQRCLERSQHDGKVLYWGLWAVQQLHGVKSLLATLQYSCSRDHFNEKVVQSTLRSLSDLAWEGDQAGLELVVEVIQSVISAMRKIADQDPNSHLLNDGAFTLGKAAQIAACEKHEGIPQLKEAALHSSNILLELMSMKVQDAALCRTVLEALGELLEASGRPSAVRSRICEGLFAGSCGNAGSGVIGAGLLSKVSAEHASNTKLQVREMSMNQSCYGVQLAALRAIAAIFYQLEANSDSVELAARAACIPAVLAAMASFPENLVMWKTACYTLNAVVQHGLDHIVQKEQLLSCLQGAAKALSIAQGQEHRSNYRDEASYLREEAVKLIAAVCITCPDFRLHLGDCKVPLAQALEAAVDRLQDDPERLAEEVEVLQHNLIALVYISGPEEILVRCLQRWGAKSSLVRACADVVAELVRRNAPMCEEMQRGPVNAELAAAVQAHKDDVELQSCFELALGFLRPPKTL